MLLDPGIKEGLATWGAQLPGTSIADFIGGEPVFAFSDYGGSHSEARYETFVTMLVGWSSLGPLITQLRALHVAAGNRTIDYKRRKDKVKSPLIPAWLAAFREHDGLCIAICHDKAASGFRRACADREKLEQDLRAIEGLTFKGSQRLIKAISFLAVVGHLIREGDRVGWVSDKDEILEGPTGAHLPVALAEMANRMIGRKLGAFHYSDPVDQPDLEYLLTLPDLVGGVLATLPRPLADGLVPRAGDEEAQTILAELSKFPHAFDTGAKGMRILPIVMKADTDREEIRPTAIRLAHPDEPDATPAPSLPA